MSLPKWSPFIFLILCSPALAQEVSESLAEETSPEGTAPDTDSAPEESTTETDVPDAEAAEPEAAADTTTDTDTEALEIDEEPPPPAIVLDRIPPRYSYEFGVHASWGTLTNWDSMSSWVGFGFRGGWGKNLGKHRIGPSLVAALEGPVTIQWTTAIEPAVSWDWISLKGLLVGASLGPSVLIHTGNLDGSTKYTTTFDITPTIAARLGYSQTWSRIGRRFFVYLEPRLRMVGNRANPLVSVGLGSGRGY